MRDEEVICPSVNCILYSGTAESGRRFCRLVFITDVSSYVITSQPETSRSRVGSGRRLKENIFSGHCRNTDEIFIKAPPAAVASKGSTVSTQIRNTENAQRTKDNTGK
jgi:hypothetical protein